MSNRNAPNIKLLRRAAIVQSLATPTTLPAAIKRLGFVQADPIRAPARAQDLILRHRVTNYRTGELDTRYAKLAIEEDFFINYGFLPREVSALMHPRVPQTVLTAATKKRIAAILDFIAEAKGAVHPRAVDAHFAHGATVNAWGGSSNATTHLLDEMHYRGLLRVARRERGIRLYALRTMPDKPDAKARERTLDCLIDIVVAQYAPIPATSITATVGRLRYGVPQWRSQLAAAISRAKSRFNHVTLDGVDWYWPHDWSLTAQKFDATHEHVRLLAPFDPIVWDRRRFEYFWGWAYRFEAYTPAPKRKLGYYALPMLWRDEIIGWANVSRTGDDQISTEFGYVTGRAPRDTAFKRALEEECARLKAFLVGPPERLRKC
jgi:uncharacterized protein